MGADFAVILRTAVTLLLLLVVTRILGRRTLSELTFYDFVIGLVLGHIAGSVITNEFDMFQGIIALAASTAWILAINMVTLQSVLARKLIESEPLLVISKGHILEKNLKDRYYNVNDLLEMLREQEIFDPSQVEAALIESDGQLSILKTSPYQAPTRQDLQGQVQGQSQSQNQSQTPASPLIGKELILSGQIIEENLAQSGLTKEQLEAKLKEQGISQISDVLLAMITPEGTLYADKVSDDRSKE